MHIRQQPEDRHLYITYIEPVMMNTQAIHQNKNSNFIKLYFGYFGTRTIVQGIFPLLTILAANQGITTDKIGVFMTIIYVAILLGTMASGRLSYIGIPSKWIMFGSAVLGAVGIVSMGQAHDFLSLTLSTSILWFFSGTYSNGATILTAILSKDKDVGEHFGTLTDVSLVATIAGGFVVGPLIQYQSYHVAFILLALLFVLPNFILLFIDEPKGAVKEMVAKSNHFKLVPNFVWMLITSGMCLMLVYVSKFTLSLDMRMHKFDLCSVSQAFAWGTVFCLPFPYWMGKLSDTQRKKPLLLICFFSIAAGLCILMVAKQYWIYIAGIVFINIMSYASAPLMSKMAYDDYDKEYVNQAQTWTNSSTWIAGIIGYLWVGFAAHHLTIEGAQLIGIVTATTSILLCAWKLKE